MAEREGYSREFLDKFLGTFSCFMRRVMHGIWREVYRDLTKSQHKTLMLIHFHGVQNMTHLANHLNLEKGSLTSVVDELIRKGYVRKIFDESDRRKHLLDLTPEGKKFVKESVVKVEKLLSRKLSVLTDDELDRLLASLEELHAITQKLVQE